MKLKVRIHDLPNLKKSIIEFHHSKTFFFEDDLDIVIRFKTIEQ